MSYWNYTGSIAQNPMMQFDKLGVPGVFHSAIKCTNNTTTVFTGSNFGASAILLNANAVNAGTEITTVYGDVITGDDLQKSVIYEIAPFKVVTPNNTDATVYVFKGRK
jgi:hypothetical protein|tara:strand:- start:102 stop:425 length:324 start_codon:yes stop_codon:yes gene_type:complete